MLGFLEQSRASCAIYGVGDLTDIFFCNAHGGVGRRVFAQEPSQSVRRLTAAAPAVAYDSRTATQILRSLGFQSVCRDDAETEAMSEVSSVR